MLRVLQPNRPPNNHSILIEALPLIICKKPEELREKISPGGGGSVMEFHFWPIKTGFTAALEPLPLPFSLPLFSSPSPYFAVLLISQTSNQHSLFSAVIHIIEAQASSHTHADMNSIYSGLMSGDSTTKTHNRLSVLLGLQFLVMLLRTYIALIQIFYLMFSRMNIFGSLSGSFSSLRQFSLVTC